MTKFNTLEKLLIATGIAAYTVPMADSIYRLAMSSHELRSYDHYIPVAVALGTLSFMGSILLNARRHKKELLANRLDYTKTA
jgi:hypothetical protein